ncbi:DUF4443 domain-containing protein [Candidatus Bathyarchaeota archaeon]|nr:DUF4443 domain-containing protein [Candidatus Bathyarchaeota archaeon]
MIKKSLENLTSARASGPAPSFSAFDVVKVLRAIAEEGAIGRGKISEKSGLGEGAVRTLLRRLSKAGLVSTSRSGCSLTTKGENLWRKISEIIPHLSEIDKSELTFAEHNFVVQVRGVGKKVRKGLEQRDAAVRAGAKGAVTMVYRNKKLALPGLTDDISHSFPKAYRQIMSLMNLKENDVVIIACADTIENAEYGALAAAWTLI